MKNHTLVNSLVLSFCLFFYAQANSSAVKQHIETIDNDLVLAVTKPDASINKAVLMIHGWTGNKDEVGNLYLKLSEILAERGIASVRVDIRGEGGAKTNPLILTSTFHSRVNDSQLAFDFMRNTFPEAEYALLGFSLGGPTALQILANNQMHIDTLVLWSSLSDPGFMFSQLTNEQKQKILSEGQITLQYWTGLTITKQHFTGYPSVDLLSPLKQYKGNVLSIRGTRDSVPPQEQVFAETFANANFEMIYVPYADHIFNVLDPTQSKQESILKLSSDWLSK